MKKIILVAVALLALFSCTSELDQKVDDIRGEKAVFYASIEDANEPDTKTYVDADLNVLWSANDRIAIFNKTTGKQEYKFKGNEGDATGVFEYVSGESDGNSVNYIYAVYPFSAVSEISSNGVLSVTYPAEQTYRANSFGVGANLMVAVAEGNNLSFKNACGYLSVRLYSDNLKVSRITLQGLNHEKLAGSATIKMDSGGTPYKVTMDESATETVSIVCDPPVQIGNSAENYTEFWFALPKTSFQSLMMTVFDESGAQYNKTLSYSGFTVGRNILASMAALKVEEVDESAIIPFVDDKFKAYCVDKYDRDGDGEINLAEARKITSVSIDASDITSLGGIEYFKNLRSLSCSPKQTKTPFVYGALTSLDLSQNKKLESVVCDYNQLESLTLTGLSSLTKLSCSNNSLTSLNLSGLSSLTRLDCSNNSLTSLNLSGLSSLTRLDCSNNSLSSLSLSDCPDLIVLGCRSNNLQELDVSQLSLTQLQCDNNLITALNVANNPNLELLYCSQNKLISLDVSNHTLLKRLRCNDNLLTTLTFTGSNAIEELRCANNSLSTLNVSALSELSSLFCSNNQLSNLDVSQNTKLASLDCSNNQLTQLPVTGLTALETLRCEYNQLDALNLTGCSALRQLQCRENEMTSLTLTDCNALEIVGCYDNQIGSLDVSGFTKLVSLLCERNKLTSLKVSGCSSLEAITCYNNLLTSLDISDLSKLKTIGVGGNTLLATLDASGCTSLQELWCNSMALASLDVSGCTALTRISCDENKLTTLDVTSCSALTGLQCAKNLLGSLLVNGCSKLINLGCNDNSLTALNLAGCTSIDQLYCCQNQIASLDLSQTSITQLTCHDNALTSLNLSGCSKLNWLDCKNNNLSSLDISDCSALSYACWFDNNPLRYLTIGQMPGVVGGTTVEIVDSEFKLDQSEISTLSIGASEQLHVAKIPGIMGYLSVTWSSNNGAVTVNTEGKITAVSSGQATITASIYYQGNQYTAECSVTVP